MRKFAAALVVAMLASFGLAACGGDDDDSSSASEPTSDDSDDTSETTNDDDADDDTGTTNGGADALDGDLRELLDRQSDAVIKVTYESDGETIVIAQDHERRAITTGGSLIIKTDDGTISCDDIDSEPTCTELPEGLGDLALLGLGVFDMIAEGLAQAADTVAGLDTSDDEIAGRDATCVEYDAASLLGELGEQLGDAEIPSGSARICVDKETGVLLELSVEGDATSSIIATKVEEPSDADFVPPAEITPIG